MLGSCLTVTLLVAGCEITTNEASDGGAGAGVVGSGGNNNAGGDNLGGGAVEDVLGGPPTIEAIFPTVAVSSGYLYIQGTHLATPSGNVTGVKVSVTGKDAGSLDVNVELEIAEGEPALLTVKIPADMHTKIVGDGTVKVETPEGSATGASPVFAVEDNGFGGAAEPGKGLVGTVYHLVTGAPTLPTTVYTAPTSWCTDTLVLSDTTTPTDKCPYTTLLAPHLQVAVRSFTSGFPGLGTNLLEWFAIHFESYLTVATAGTYGFATSSDDGSKLYIKKDGAWVNVVSNDGQHGMSKQIGSIDLTAGTYPIVVDYFQGPATQIGLELYWTAPGGTEELVPATAFGLFPAPN